MFARFLAGASPRKSRQWAWGLELLCVLAPLALLASLRDGFFTDWPNHLWNIGYVGEFFRQHGTLPKVLNTNQLAGMAQPMFYGYLFYPLFGVFSAWMGSNLASRFLIAGLWWIQFRTVRRTSIRCGVETRTAWFIACCFSWSTYALTNLYNRSALTEFFASSLLVIATCQFIELLLETDKKRTVRLAVLFGYTFTLCAGSHPITAMLAAPFLALLGVLHVLGLPGPRNQWRSKLILLGGTAGMSVLVLLPCLIAIGIFHQRLFISVTFHEVIGYKDSIDGNLNRFALLPQDTRVQNGILTGVSTPYLDAQTCAPLFLLLIYCLGRARSLSGMAIAGLLNLLLSSIFSLSPRVYTHLPNVFSNVQFIYRLITFQNLSFLMIFLGLSQAKEGAVVSRNRISDAVLFLCLGLALVGLAIKLQHGSTSMEPLRAVNSNYLQLPDSYYGNNDYLDETWRPKLYPTTEKLPVHRLAIRFLPSDGPEFGLIHPVDFRAQEPGWYQTNYAAFPWVSASVDGHPLPWDRLALYEGRICLLISDLAPHRVEIQPNPPTYWKALRVLSFSLGLLWSLVVILLAVFSHLRVMPIDLPPSPLLTSPQTHSQRSKQ